MLTVTDPAWFFSSLAQVTGAIVGFAGGFLILRLQGYITDWERLLARLETGQTQWLLTTDRYHTIERGDVWDHQLSIEKNQRWAELMRAQRELDDARMPAELVVAGILLIGLVAVGIVWPLLALGAPTNGAQISYLSPWGLLILAVGGVMFWRANSALSRLRSFKLRGDAAAQLEDEKLQEEGWIGLDMDKLAESDPAMKKLLDVWPRVRDWVDPYEAAHEVLSTLEKRLGHESPLPEVGLTKPTMRRLLKRRRAAESLSDGDREAFKTRIWDLLVAYTRWALGRGD